MARSDVSDRCSRSSFDRDIRALLVGYLTPLVSVLAGLAGLSSGVPVISGPTSSLLATKPAVAFATAIAAALCFLGPGAFSLDARLFGRREIVFSNSHPPSDL
jgi:hypothetical protein